MERIKDAVEKARGERRANPSVPECSWVTEPQRTRPAFGVDAWLRTRPVTYLNAHHLQANRVVAFDHGNPMRGVFDLLRTQVLQRMAEEGWKTLAVTSPTAGAGKTVVSVNLAMSIAHHPQHSAILVDFDLRRPSIGGCLGLPAGTTLSDLLEGGEEELQNCVFNVGLPRLAVVPASRPIAAASDVLSSAQVSGLIRELRATDADAITVFDLPPVTAVDDVIAVLPKIDCVLLVVGNGNSTKREIEEAQRHLARYPLVGTVINKASAPLRKQGYYDYA